MKKAELKFFKKIDEVFSLEPNNLGSQTLTNFYHSMTSLLKRMPFIIILPSALFVALLFFLNFREMVVRFVTLLQYGF